MQTSTRISHWIVYFAGPIDGKGNSSVIVSQIVAQQFREAMMSAQVNATIPLVTGKDMNPTTARTLYVNPSSVIALEPVSDTDF